MCGFLKHLSLTSSLFIITKLKNGLAYAWFYELLLSPLQKKKKEKERKIMNRKIES